MYPQVYKEIKPSKHLKDYIKCYWLYEKSFGPGQFEHVMPDSSYELVHTDEPVYRVDGAEVSALFLVGQLKHPADFYAEGKIRQWCVRFYPWGLLPFGDVAAIAEKVWVPASDVLGSEASSTLQSIPAGTPQAELTFLLNNYFVRRLLAWQFDDSFLKRAAHRLLQEKGDIKIEELAKYCYLSRRQVVRNIRQATGRAPHEVASRLRFEAARDALMHNPDIPIAHLAHEYGYSDQPHVVKEFKQYADMTPSEYATMFRKLQPQMQGADVSFLQS